MNYITVYSTKDENEVSVLKDLFDDEKIDFRILKDENAAEKGGGVSEKRFQVAEKDKHRAQELVDQTGFLRTKTSATGPAASTRMAGEKWMYFFLAALIIVLAGIFLTWFMNVS